MKSRERLGKYRIERRLARGGFAEVYQARDTVEGIAVALKIPYLPPDNREVLLEVRREVQLTARLQHPNILPIKNADFIGDRFVIVYPLGEGSLDDRMKQRLPARTVLNYADQMLAGLAYAHRRRIMHCDVKPENFILFPGDQLKLGDFGIAKMARRTLAASGSGTLGYVAPEQAMGHPSFRSDVFSMGLVIYQLFTGHLPQWPYEWPLPGDERLKRKVSREMVQFLRRALAVDSRKRFANADQMHSAFNRLKGHALAGTTRKRRTSRKKPTVRDARAWEQHRHKQFLREFRKALGARYECKKCSGPVSEPMQACPWCGTRRDRHTGDSSFPAECRRCHRGMKLDWRYCPWCFGPAYEPLSDKEYSDVRYEGRCSNPRCSRKDLMPFMRYCPWCRTKVRRRWKVPHSTKTCAHCGWGVLPHLWDHCPWCAKRLRSR